MKLTNKQLEQIIKEELQNVLSEQDRESRPWNNIPEGTGSDFEKWNLDNIINSEHFKDYTSALSDLEAFWDPEQYRNSNYTQEQKDQKESELLHNKSRTFGRYRVHRNIMQRNMTPEQEEKSDGIIYQHLENYSIYRLRRRR